MKCLFFLIGALLVAGVMCKNIHKDIINSGNPIDPDTDMGQQIPWERIRIIPEDGAREKRAAAGPDGPDGDCICNCG